MITWGSSKNYGRPSGSVAEGRIIALGSEAGYQAALLRGGVHLGYLRWQYAVHKVRLVSISEGKIGYVYARDGEPLPPGQTLARVVECNNFQNASAFLSGPTPGQRGRQRAVLREGVYAINLAVFTVITETKVHALPDLVDKGEWQVINQWRDALLEIDGFSPIVVGRRIVADDPLELDGKYEVDSIGIVTVHDGPSLEPGEIIAPAVGNDSDEPNYHNNYQEPEAFLAAGGRRGRQYVPLTDGTYFINRWFASVELIPKTVVPIGYVGVVVSYYGREGQDVTGTGFRHGERVGEGERGVRQRPFGPGKYAFNTFAGSIVLVPTTNFVLHWITGKTETHRYDESLKSIDLVTKDAYEPLLPLSVVVHIDYERAPGVIQRFGDVKKLITQTLDPMLERVLPRYRAHEDDARAAARAADDSAGGSRCVADQVPRVRYRMRRRADRQARSARRRQQDRNALGTTAATSALDRASRNVRSAANRCGKAADLARSRGECRYANEVDQRPRERAGG